MYTIFLFEGNRNDYSSYCSMLLFLPAPSVIMLCCFRASDKKRNLAQQKAEAQRRLYGHGSMKKLSASSSDWEKQRHSLERRREELV